MVSKRLGWGITIACICAFEQFCHFPLTLPFSLLFRKLSFNGVSPDMMLDQTIQRLQTPAAGIISQTRRVSYVTEWELIYPEDLAILNVYQNITSAGLSF